MGDGWLRSSALAEANRNILLYLRDGDDGELEWEFFCECGRDNCHEHVFLTLDALIAIQDGGGVVLAEGHSLSQADRAQSAVERARKNAQP